MVLQRSNAIIQRRYISHTGMNIDRFLYNKHYLFFYLLYCYRGYESGVRACNRFYLSQPDFLRDQFLAPIHAAAPPITVPHSPTPSRPLKKEWEKRKRERKDKEKGSKERKLKEQRKVKGNVDSHGYSSLHPSASPSKHCPQPIFVRIGHYTSGLGPSKEILRCDLYTFCL